MKELLLNCYGDVITQGYLQCVSLFVFATLLFVASHISFRLWKHYRKAWEYHANSSPEVFVVLAVVFIVPAITLMIKGLFLIVEVIFAPYAYVIDFLRGSL